MTTRLIIDCDTGTDDAIAIYAAALHPELELVAVTTTHGNVSLDHTTDNTLRVLDSIGARIPVHAGAARPMVRPDLPIPREILNADSDFQIDTLDLPDPISTATDVPAARFLVDTYLDPANSDVVLVATGPLTNVALALAADPRIAARIPRLVLMGGADVGGNVSPVAEFNIWCDPEAARVVFAAGIREIVVLPLDATHSVPLSLEDCAAWEELGTPAALASAAFLRHRIEQDQGTEGTDETEVPVHDPVCVAYLIDPGVVTESITCPVDVESSGELTVGQLILDRRPWSTTPANATVALRGSLPVFRSFLRDALAVERWSPTS